ncbi:MAG: hypothetical protein U0793_06715 [Gemmataceae bacterium]
MLRMGSALVLAALFVFTASDADAQKKKKKAKAIKGTIAKVEEGKEAGQGAIFVKITNKKTKTSEEKKVAITKKTDIEELVGKKKDKTMKQGAFADLKAGRQINVTLRAGTDQAEKVVLGPAKKKKKQAAS